MSSSELDISSRRQDNLTNADLIRTIGETVLRHFKNSKLYSALSNIGRGRSSIVVGALSKYHELCIG
jgi:hypothetical protein